MSMPSREANDRKGIMVETARNDTSPHVLVVDDSLVDRLVASKLLKQSANIQVTATEGPKQALRILDEENDVNLILTDYCMPEMSGYDLLMTVKESSKLKHLPVVIMSSDNIPTRIKECMDGGAKDYILKPINVADMPHILKYI